MGEMSLPTCGLARNSLATDDSVRTLSCCQCPTLCSLSTLWGSERLQVAKRESSVAEAEVQSALASVRANLARQGLETAVIALITAVAA